MARARRVREEEVAGPTGPPVPPPWYRDIWPWLLALGLIVLGIVGGYFAYEAYQDNEDDEPEVVTVTTTEGDTGTTTGSTTSRRPRPSRSRLSRSPFRTSSGRATWRPVPRSRGWGWSPTRIRSHRARRVAP